MQFTLNENESFTLLTCGACGTRHAISTPRYEELRRTKASFYCPLVSVGAFVKSEVEVAKLCERALAHTRTRYPLPLDVRERASAARAQLQQLVDAGQFAEVK